MFAPQNQQPNVIDSMSGSMEEWYNAIDDAVKKSEVIPGNYEYTVATSYGNVGPIPEGSSTYFDVSCDRFKVVSLDNSFITIEQDVEVEIPKPQETSNKAITTYYIGYKYAGDVIDQYRLYSNTDLIQTQNHARYEWFMMYNSISDEAKRNSDLYATLDKIREKNPFVPGVYVDVGAISDATKTIQVHLKVRVPVSAFLTLFNLRFFPNWSGKLSIEIYPSYKNLCIVPVVPQKYLLSDKLQEKIAGGPSEIELGFKNINQPMKNHLVVANFGASGEAWTITAQTFKCNGTNCKADKCKIRLATYLLKMDVFNALAAKYIQVQLIFPIQTIQIKDFTNGIPNGAGHFTTANTLALKHCDALFAVFKKDVNARTCFENPFIKFQFNVDGKLYPREQNETYNDERFINQNLDALNLNNSLITSPSKDLRNSLQPFHELNTYNNSTGKLDSNKVWNDGDFSNFMIGIPFCDSEDFYGGISTTGTVQIELSGERPNELSATAYTATAICFEDCLLKVRAMKPNGRSQIEITNASIEELLRGLAY